MSKKTKAELIEELENKQKVLDHVDRRLIFTQDELNAQRKASRARIDSLNQSLHAHRTAIAVLAVLLLFALLV